MREADEDGVEKLLREVRPALRAIGGGDGGRGGGGESGGHGKWTVAVEMV